MRFALLGDHSDGLDLARALVESGRHELACYSGSAFGLGQLRRWLPNAASVGDLEEVLADPAIDAVLVGGPPGDRGAQLRRALQSERHVFCVQPADQTPDTAHEAAMMQADTHCLLLPILPDALHPALARFAELLKKAGRFRLLEWERWATEYLVLDGETAGHKPGLPGWDVLRRLGGEIAEVFAYAADEEIEPDQPLLVAGRFLRGGMFQLSLVPRQPEARWRLTVLTEDDRLELCFPEGWPGACQLTWSDDDGMHHEDFPAWNPWPAFVEVVEGASRPRRRLLLMNDNTAISADPAFVAIDTTPARITWQDAIRCLELDDAARRSVSRRRASTLEYQEATEEAGFKGTMTLVGCGLLWGSVFLLIMARWFPWIGYLIVPLFAFFLVMQLLRGFVPASPSNEQESGASTKKE